MVTAAIFNGLPRLNKYIGMHLCSCLFIVALTKKKSYKVSSATKTSGMMEDNSELIEKGDWWVF
jgi:hypothetical protein